MKPFHPLNYPLNLTITCFILLLLVYTSDTYAQVSISNRVWLTARNVFNYQQSSDTIIKTKKDPSPRIVFIDRNNCQSYEDPYFQRKRGTSVMETPCYIIGENNGAYKLVLAEQDIIGRPQSVFGFLYSGKRHFKEADKVKFIGWIPKEYLLMYDHAYISPINNRPIRYRIGINSIHRLFDLKQYFNGDTLRMYSDPFLKSLLKCSVTTGDLVYLYKLDQTGKAALIADVPVLSDTTKSAFGWIPADLLAEVGQNEVYKTAVLCCQDSVPAVLKAEGTRDTLYLRPENISNSLLFNLNGNSNHIEPSTICVNLPISVWDKKWNKILNIKGGDIMISDVKMMEAGNKHVNLHVLFYDTEGSDITPYINVLQNLKLKLRPNYQYTFSATKIAEQGHNSFLPPTSDFASWLDFIKASSLHKVKDKTSTSSGLSGAIKDIASLDKGYLFDNNIFIIFGTKQVLEINKKEMEYLASRPYRLLFIQTRKSYDKSYQDFLLQAKSILNTHSTDYINYISNYIADNKLIKYELFRIHDSAHGNTYLYDAPNNSLNVGGLVFPKGSSSLESTAFETALDSVLVQSYTIDSLLTTSLKKYERKLGVMRSHPSPELKTLFLRSILESGVDAKAIVRNSINDTYYTKVSFSDSTILKSPYGYLFNDTEIRALLQNYRALLPEFSDSIGKKELKILRKLYKKQIKVTNQSLRRQTISKKSTVADLFYYKTGIAFDDSIFHSIRIRDLRRRRIDKDEFTTTYRIIIHKMKCLENMYQQNLFETVTIASRKYYFIAKQEIL